MKATLQTYRQSPRKVRLLADLIRGKKIPEALNNLAFADKRAGPVFAKLLKSAVANATNNDSISADDLFVKEVSVNQGVTMKRMMPRARGAGARINKRTSHLSIVLGIKELSNPKAKKAEVAETKEVKPKKVVKKVAKAKKA